MRGRQFYGSNYADSSRFPCSFRRLSQDREVQRLLRAFHDQGKLVGMICAGVLAAKTSGIALGQRLTSHPSVKGELEKRECGLRGVVTGQS